ncbi:MAG TPA: SDR family oxidoreductase [Acidimicrobiales bacterium]|nr:SDR family oxidoreductase [Acidimicrobiales bacterium]
MPLPEPVDSRSLFDVSGKTVLVTGGSRGIGRMIAHGFVAAGARVYISARSEEELASAQAELAAHGECHALRADLSSEAGARALVEGLAEREPALHVLVNNAGANWGAPLESHDDAALERVLALNVKGTFHVTRFAVPLLKAAATPEDPARIITVGSVAGMIVPDSGVYGYAASKAAVHSLSRHLARELTPDHITVNVLAPGSFPSKMTQFIFEAPKGEEFLIRRIPAGRTGRTADIAGPALFLASRAAAYVSGAVLTVDGGWSLLG